MRPDRDAILKALENVIDPELRRPVTELDMVRDVLVEDDGSVSVTIALTVAGCPLRDSLQEQVSRHVGAVPGVTRVRLGFDVMTPEEKQALVSRLRGGESAERTISLSPSTRVIAVASGKGGVGKSTLTANLAAARPALRTVTTRSPLGSALVGKREGDEVVYEAPGGNFTYEIVSIRPWDGS